MDLGQTMEFENKAPEPAEAEGNEESSVTFPAEHSPNETLEDETQEKDADGQALSKNQLKKLRKREKWLAIKQDKRRNAKLKRKMRLAEMREAGEDTGPTRKSLKRKTMKDSTCKIRVAIDLGLDEYMTEKDVNSLTCQLQHSYAANRRAENSLQLYFCGISGKTKERLDRIGDYKGWDIYPDARTYDQVFPKESLVYLSSESDNILTTLEEDKVYVIGGLVDHNKHKGLCHQLAEEKGIAHAQLPISDFLDMKTRKVLTVNQVFAILVRYTEMQDWQKAFMAEMPQRKQAFAKNGDQVDSSDTQESKTLVNNKTNGDEAGSASEDKPTDSLKPSVNVQVKDDAKTKIEGETVSEVQECVQSSKPDEVVKPQDLDNQVLSKIENTAENR